METANVAVKPNETKPAENAPQQGSQQPKEVDLVTRVSQVKFEAPKAEQTQNIDDTKFDFSEYEKIKDPEAGKAWLLKAYKSLQSGSQSKFEEAARIRKEYESKQAELTNWTPQRVQDLLSNPGFIEAAKSVRNYQQNPDTSGLTDEEYSNLSDKEKQQLTLLQQEVAAMKKDKQQSVLKEEFARQDAQISGKYSNYDSKLVDKIQDDLINNRIIATREDLWKVADYENAVKRAYQLGLQEKELNNQEKINSSSFGGINANSSAEKPQQQQGETNQAYFRRLYDLNAARKNGKK